ncbi:SRPBCC family protein [Gryllotalpicola ginsengisoli]|uniref:SRPBCC family protein n=1 Tax=Gryllotalpicola ginsengisoli TaxID=444608 RepID=UPI0003B49A44|nr:SRPBCC family protein [Gryllotalpicola ginsengisoli]
MAVAHRLVHASPERVFAVLADGWSYPAWVVGASRIRAVDAGWPQPGARLHHSFGVWPVLIDDITVMREWDPPRRAVLQARGGAVGRAKVVLETRTRGDGCVVRMFEDVEEGPGHLVPRPVRDVAGTPRLVETLRRLAFLAERRSG